MKKILHLMKVSAFVLAVAAFVLLSGCGQVAEDAEKKTSNTAAKTKLSDFDSELHAMRTAEFDYIFALRRKDKGIIDADDKRFVKNIAPNTTNRFTLTKDEKAIFTGSNFPFDKEVLESFGSRFEVLDFSKSKEMIEKQRKAEQERNENKAT